MLSVHLEKPICAPLPFLKISHFVVIADGRNRKWKKCLMNSCRTPHFETSPKCFSVTTV